MLHSCLVTVVTEQMYSGFTFSKLSAIYALIQCYFFRWTHTDPHRTRRNYFPHQFLPEIRPIWCVRGFILWFHVKNSKWVSFGAFDAFIQLLSTPKKMLVSMCIVYTQKRTRCSASRPKCKIQFFLFSLLAPYLKFTGRGRTQANSFNIL